MLFVLGVIVGFCFALIVRYLFLDKPDGVMKVYDTDHDTRMHSLELTSDPDKFEKKKRVVFKVETNPET